MVSNVSITIPDLVGWVGARATLEQQRHCGHRASSSLKQQTCRHVDAEVLVVAVAVAVALVVAVAAALAVEAAGLAAVVAVSRKVRPLTSSVSALLHHKCHCEHG